MSSPRRSPRASTSKTPVAPGSGVRLSETMDLAETPAPTPKRRRDDGMDVVLSPYVSRGSTPRGGQRAGAGSSGAFSAPRGAHDDRHTSLSPKAKSKFGVLRVTTGDSDEEDNRKGGIEPLPAGVQPMQVTPGRMTRGAARRMGEPSPGSPFAAYARTLSPIVPLSSPALFNFNMFQSNAASPHKVTEPWVHDRAHSVSPVQQPQAKSPAAGFGNHPASAPPATNKPPLPKGASARRLDFSKPQPGGSKTPQGKMIGSNQMLQRAGSGSISMGAVKTPVKMQVTQISTPQSMAAAAAAAAAAAPPTPQVCNCKKSKCLKLYCECFASGELCKAGCNCVGCANSDESDPTRKEAVDATLKRNPSAFIRKMNTMSPDVSDRIEEDKIAIYKQHKGCHCKKSGCLKKYCECFQAGILCMDHCKCQDCKNFEGSGELEAVLQQNASPAVPGTGSATKRARMTPVQEQMAESPAPSHVHPKRLAM